MHTSKFAHFLLILDVNFPVCLITLVFLRGDSYSVAFLGVAVRSGADSDRLSVMQIHAL